MVSGSSSKGESSSSDKARFEPTGEYFGLAGEYFGLVGQAVKAEVMGVGCDKCDKMRVQSSLRKLLVWVFVVRRVEVSAVAGVTLLSRKHTGPVVCRAPVVFLD